MTTKATSLSTRRCCKRRSIPTRSPPTPVMAVWMPPTTPVRSWCFPVVPPPTKEPAAAIAMPPWVETDYTYDDFNPSSGLQAGYHNLTQEVISSSNAPTLTKKWSYTTTDSGEPGSGYIYYDVDKVTHSEIDGASGKVWQCQDITYDQGAPSGVTTPDAGWPTTIKSYSDCANQSSTAITTYQGYDAYGNPVASVDGVATANSSLYSSNGC